MQNAIWRRAEEGQTIRTECSKDFILPDAYPDIRRILHTAGTLCPGHSAIENGRFTDSGSLVCSVLFSDENDELHSISFTLEYSVLSPMNEESSEMVVSAEEILQNVSARALNPRKLGIRAKIEITPRICRLADAGPDVSQEIDIRSIEKQSVPLSYWKLGRQIDYSLEASEDLSLPGESGLQEIVFSHLNMGNASCEAQKGALRFAGEATLELIYRTLDGILCYAELPIPFSSTIDADLTPEALCTVKLTPEALSCVPSEDATGEAHGIELDFTYTVSAWIAQPIECTRVTDCYSTACPTATEEGSVSVVQSMHKLQKQQRSVLTCPADGMKKSMKCFAKAYIESTEREEGKLTLHCIAEIDLLGMDGEGKAMSLTLTEAFPWELEEADDANALFTASGDCVLQGDELKVTLTVTAELLTWQNARVSYVSSLRPTGEMNERCRTAITLCYPLPGEGMWEIAKRYRLPQSVLLAANSVPEGAMPKVLLIPAEKKPIFSKMI